jgi:hypothetical protein
MAYAVLYESLLQNKELHIGRINSSLSNSILLTVCKDHLPTDSHFCPFWIKAEKLTLEK